ncbi:PadR family transcriptional regulator [Antribacter gilvus]|uniref:PadR family transcriptional regulator n=1 Tax=Antribacter gilvus TaxID=2304675 RepID=UPI00198172B0|nr:helix-turn-helix transcriptional regulator [Antribacter gilvus]
MTLDSRPRSPLAMVLLALLAEEPMHAYRMQRLIKTRRKDDVVNVARSNSVYQAIERLVRDGLIEVHEKRAADTAPARIVYALTATGRDALRRWMDAALATPAREFPEFRAVLAVLAITAPDLVRVRLEERAAALEVALEQAAHEAAYAQELSLPRVLMLEHEHFVTVTQAELGWVRQVVADLRTGSLTWDTKEILASRPPD